MQRQSGISLLEMLLVLVLAGIIITMAVRYFTITNRSEKVLNAINQIKTLSSASYRWLQGHRQANFSDEPNGTAINTEALIDAKLINKSETINPWGGEITIGPGTNPSYVQIKIASMPAAACMNLKQRLKSVAHDAGADSQCNEKDESYYLGEF